MPNFVRLTCVDWEYNQKKEVIMSNGIGIGYYHLCETVIDMDRIVSIIPFYGSIETINEGNGDERFFTRATTSGEFTQVNFVGGDCKILPYSFKKFTDVLLTVGTSKLAFSSLSIDDNEECWH